MTYSLYKNYIQTSQGSEPECVSSNVLRFVFAPSQLMLLLNYFNIKSLNVAKCMLKIHIADYCEVSYTTALTVLSSITHVEI